MKPEARNHKSANESAGFTLLISAFFFVLSMILFGSPRLGLGQAPEEQGLTPTNFRAPDFPNPGDNSANSGPVSPAAPDRTLPGAQTTSPLPAGESLEPSLWINSPPLTMGQLHGRVVLIDFWEYTCINCIRTFAQNEEWYKRYHKYGFEIIGVHDPEFDIAYRAANVRVAVERFGLP